MIEYVLLEPAEFRAMKHILAKTSAEKQRLHSSGLQHMAGNRVQRKGFIRDLHAQAHVSHHYHYFFPRFAANKKVHTLCHTPCPAPIGDFWSPTPSGLTRLMEGVSPTDTCTRAILIVLTY